MRTNMQVSPRVDSGELLLRQVETLGDAIRRHTVFDSENRRFMEAAIQTLLCAGYRLQALTGVQMIEDSVYELSLIAQDVYPANYALPYWIKLRYITDGMPGSGPKLALAYRRNGWFAQYTGSYHFAHRTDSSEAERMVLDFERDHPGTPYQWVPVFGSEWMPL